MADNVTVDNGALTDYIVVADEITSPYTGGSAQAQGMKILGGAANDATVVAAGGGVEANALRVTLASDSTGLVSVDDNGGSLTIDDGGGSITVDGSVSISGSVTSDTELTTADLDTGAGTDTRAVVGLVKAASGGGVLVSDANPLPIWDAGSTVSVDDGGGSLTVDGTVAVSGTVTVDSELTTADLDTGAGTDTRAVVGIAKAASGGAVLVSDANPFPISDAGGSITVDGSVSLAAALPAGTSNIGDVDVLTVPAPLSTTGGGTEATALRVTLANDSTGLVSVDDNGGSLTVDGSVSITGAVDTELTTADLDTGAGTDTRAVVGLVIAKSGGAANISNTDPMPVSDAGGTLTVDDGGGSLTVDGTVTAVASGDHTVVGKAADGAAVSGNPVLVAGQDGTNTQSLKTDANGELQVDVLTMPTVTVTDGLNVEGDVAHDAVDSGNPLKVGAKAVAHGANPTAVAAADRTDLYANRHGVQFVIGGHPNAKSATYNTTAAQTDDNIMAAIAGGTKYAITRITVTLDEATTVGVAVRIGFGATTVPALGASGADAVDDILLYHPGLVPGAVATVGDGSGVLGVGGDGAELRITNEVPTSGTLGVTVTYFTIES